MCLRREKTKSSNQKRRGVKEGTSYLRLAKPFPITKETGGRKNPRQILSNDLKAVSPRKEKVTQEEGEGLSKKWQQRRAERKSKQ